MRVDSELALAPLGLRSRHLIALTLLRDQGGSTQQALASTIGMDRTNLVGLLNELEEEGLIERRRSQEDRRRHLVELTDEGNRYLATAEFLLADSEERVLGALSSDERATLAALLQKATADSQIDFATDTAPVPDVGVEGEPAPRRRAARRPRGAGARS